MIEKREILVDLSRIDKKIPSGPGSDKARIIFLVVITAIVVVAFFFFRFQSAELAQENAAATTDHILAPPSRIEVSAKVDPALLVDVKDSTISERVVKEMDPFLHLIKQAAKLIPGDMELLNVSLCDPEALLADSAAFRGKPLSIKGNLQWWEKENFQDFQLYRGYLTTLKGESVYFTVLNMSDEVSIGDVVKLEGFFFKIFSFTLPGDGTRVSEAPFLVGRRLINSFYEMEPVNELDMDLLGTIYDYSLEDSSREFQEKPLFHVLSYVHNMNDETFNSIDFPDTLASEILFRSSTFRGQPVKVAGHPIWTRTRMLGPGGENPIGIEKVFHGILLNHKGGFCYYIALDIPRWLSSDYKDLINIKGFFLRNYSYVTRKGTPQSAPVLVVGGFEKFVYPEDNTMAYVTFFIIGLTVLIVGFFFFTIFVDRKRSKEYRTRFIENKKKLLRRALAGAASPNTTDHTAGDDRPGGDTTA